MSENHPVTEKKPDQGISPEQADAAIRGVVRVLSMSMEEIRAEAERIRSEFD